MESGQGQIGEGRAKEFFLSIRESWEECEKTNAKVGGGRRGRIGGGGGQSSSDSCEMEKQMQRGGKSIMAGESKYSRVLSLLGLCRRCHVELA